jgi:hypothetical protein
LLTLSNPTGADIAVPVDYVNNFGSDGFTTVGGTSSGDASFAAGDRWVVTHDTIAPDEAAAQPNRIFLPVVTR